MSFVGILSLPVLLLSLMFIFLHSKFIELFNEHISNQNTMFELVRHKLDLLLFFAQDNLDKHEILLLEPRIQNFDVLTLELRLQFITELELLLGSVDLCDDDGAELEDINNEIEEAQNMYNQSKANFCSFTHKLPGRLFATFLADKSLK